MWELWPFRTVAFMAYRVEAPHPDSSEGRDPPFKALEAEVKKNSIPAMPAFKP